MTVYPKGNIPFGEYFGRALALYGENFSLFFPLSMASVGMTVIKALLSFSHDHRFVLLAAMLGPVEVCFYVYFLAALIFSVGSRADGSSVGFSDIFLSVWQRFWRCLGGYLLFGLSLLAGIFLLVLPGIYCLTVFYFFIFAILFEDKSVLAAFKRSDELVKGSFIKVLSAHAVVIFIFGILITFLFVGARLMGWDRNVLLVVADIIAAAAMPVFLGFYYAVFLHLKNEKDGVLGISLRAV